MSAFERGTVVARSDTADDEPGVFIETVAHAVFLRPDDFRWLILTAGPALLYGLQRGEEDAGGDGGGTPPPAHREATEAPDEPEPDLFGATIPDDRADPHTVPCPSCKSPRGTACMTPGGMVARPHAARRRLVET